MSSARSDDTKGLKGSILEWITPKGQSLNPPLARNVKMDRGFHHERTGALLCPAGLDWSDPKLKNPSSTLLGSHRNHSIKQSLRSGETTVTGDQWPIFLYSGFNYDADDPWNGLFRSTLLVSVSHSFYSQLAKLIDTGIQTHFHLTQFGGERAQGDARRKCSHPRNDESHAGIYCVCCHAGMSSGSFLSISPFLFSPRFGLPCARHLYSQEPTP